MNRVKLNYPETQDSWNELPQEFKNYLDVLDEVRLSEVKTQVIDPLYPSYDYDWELDEEIPLRTVLEYWNRDDELPEPIVILNEIQDGMEEAAYDAFVSSYYSY